MWTHDKNKPLLALLAFVIGLMPTTVFAVDDDAENTADEEKPNPIKKLVEIRIDPFLVPARALNVPLPGRVRTSQELLERLEKLAADDEVGGVLLNLDGLALALPHVEELRQGLLEFRKSGKQVRSFLNSGDPNSYLLACASDEIAIAPSGALTIPGIGRVFTYMRGFYQMQGIEYDVITAGKFKYPGFVNQREPGDAFTSEYGALLDSWYGDYVKMIAEGRNLSEEKVKELIDMGLFEPEGAKNRELVDVISYYDDYRERILRREKFKRARDFESSLARVTSLQDLLTQITKEMQDAQNRYKQVGPKIAVLHARGPIVDMNLGAGFASSLIMRDQMVKTIEEIRKNKTIRAVVLHIDSPGGSAYASDIIWRALKELDAEKPVIACMSTVAASGGYYIAAPCRLIYAQPTTVTGSIGVIAMLANQASAINRMDINVYEMKRGERSLLGSGHKGLTNDDKDFLQSWIMETYDQFLSRVAEGRKMPKEQVKKLAGGRIYSGRDALEKGLVDRLGSLSDAVDAVRQMANIPESAEVKLVHYPRPSSLGELAESLFGVTGMMQAATLADSPAPQITLDRQLKFFTRNVAPLCWSALPDLHAPFGQIERPEDAARELLGLPALDAKQNLLVP